MNMNRNTVTYFTAVGVGVVVCVGASSYYLFYKIHNLIQRELRTITQIVTDIKKDISDLRSNTKRKGLAAGSSFSDETSDVYYEFSDEGDFAFGFEQEHEKEDEDYAETESSNSEEQNADSENLLLSEFSNFSNDTILKHDYKIEGKLNFKKNLDVIDDVLERLSVKPVNYLSLHKKVLRYHSKYFNKHEYLWRLAKACHICATICGENKNSEMEKDYMERGLKYATNALALTDNDANVHKWYAICIGSCAAFESIQNKIKYGFAFKEHAQLALQLNSSDESLYHMMGRWCYEVANMPWIERKVATTIYGAVPTATLQEARNYFITADNLHCSKGIWKENSLYLAKTYIGERQYEQAIVWLDKAVEETSSLPEDPIIMKEIEDLRIKYATYRVKNIANKNDGVE